LKLHPRSIWAKFISGNDMPAYPKSKQTGNKTITAEEFKSINANEKALQDRCEEYLQYFPDIAVIRIPDAVYRAIFANNFVSAHIKKLISKYLKGLPDLILLKKHDSFFCKAVCIELKTKKGKQSQGQKHFANKVPVILCRSFEHFQKIVKEI